TPSQRCDERSSRRTAPAGSIPSRCQCGRQSTAQLSALSPGSQTPLPQVGRQSDGHVSAFSTWTAVVLHEPSPQNGSGSGPPGVVDGELSHSAGTNAPGQ